MNLPNKLTLFRVALIPVFVVLSLRLPGTIAGVFISIGLEEFVSAYDRFVDGAGYIAAGIIFLTAFATDALDGYIARKYKLVTDFGAFLDPIADKLLVTAALVVLVVRGVIGAWIPIIIISREFVVTGLRLLAANKGIVLAADGFGKAKTAAQSVALTMLLFRNFNVSLLDSINAGGVLLYVAMVLTVFSGINYIVKNRGLFGTA